MQTLSDVRGFFRIRTGTVAPYRDFVSHPFKAANDETPQELFMLDATEEGERAKNEGIAFRTVGRSENVNLIPLFKLFKERYTVYWKVKGKAA